VQVSLSRLVVMVGEWIPFGCNHITELSLKLGVRDRIKGGFFTSVVDTKSSETSIQVDIGLTRVFVNSYDEAQWLNIEAEVDYPEEDGIVQVEHFGIRYQRDGVTTYGFKLEAVMESVIDNISLDHLSRVMSDIHIDSSKLSKSLMSPHQDQLLEMVFAGHADNRNKINVFIAEGIEPKMRAAKYLDGGACECELKQVIGDVYHAFDITENDIVIFGALGVLFAGPDCIRHETLLLAYLGIKAREIFVHNFFNRLFVIADGMKVYRDKIEKYFEDPNAVAIIRKGLDKIYDDTSLMAEVLRHLEMSLEVDPLPPHAMPQTKAGKRLYQVLQIESLLENLDKRVRDCNKQVQATYHEINFLKAQINNEAKVLLERVKMETRSRYADSLQQVKRNEAAGSALDIMQWLFAGSLAFNIIDRSVGEWTLFTEEWARLQYMYPLVLNPSMYWLVLSMLTWLVGGVVVLGVLRIQRDQVTGAISFHGRLFRHINLARLEEYMREKGVRGEEIVGEQLSPVVLQVYTYVDTNSRLWQGYAPQITLKVDVKGCYIRSADVFIEKPSTEQARIFPRELFRRLVNELEDQGVLLEHVHRVQLVKQQETAAKILRAKRPNDTVWRELVIRTSTTEELFTALAAKFCYKRDQLMEVSYTRQVEDESFVEIIDADDQVGSLRSHTELVVIFKGRPDPSLGVFAQHLAKIKQKAAPGQKLDLSAVKKLGAQKKAGPA